MPRRKPIPSYALEKALASPYANALYCSIAPGTHGAAIDVSYTLPVSRPGGAQVLTWRTGSHSGITWRMAVRAYLGALTPEQERQAQWIYQKWTQQRVMHYDRDRVQLIQARCWAARLWSEMADHPTFAEAQ
jgi:hypothetical protein